MTARTLNNVVNDQTVALNALIYGYGGHSLVTPQYALQQIWWTEERIDEKVNEDYVNSRLQPKEREWLSRPVGFGDLTDDTYLEWILEKARRLFLILVEIGEADRIFAVVEKSWDDDDLPLSMDDIEQLALANRRDDQANIRFYQTQFSFLLRVLGPGLHVDYASNEQIPLEFVMGLPPAVALQPWSRVHLPKKPHEVLVRRKFPLGNAESTFAFEDDYIMDVESAQMVEHDHIAPIWASYTSKGCGYTLTNFVGQHTLKTFIDHREPPQYKRLSKPERRQLVLNWMLCLSDAVATLHRNGFCHSAIRPSNIIIDEHNNIAFSDIASLSTFTRDKKPDPMDAYIYGAAETQNATDPVEPDVPPPPPIIGTRRKPSIASKSSSGSSNSSGSRQKLTKSPVANDFSGFNFGFRRMSKQPVQRQRSRSHETEQADVYSLGCCFVEMVTFMLKKKPTDFVKHRSTKQKEKVNTGGKNSRTDSSYHANMDKIESWMKLLENSASAFEHEEFVAIPHILILVRTMLSRNAHMRPSAREVRSQLLDILLEYTTVTDIHCGSFKHEIAPAPSSRSGSDGGWTNSNRASSISGSSLASSSASSDADTIRESTSSSRMSSILNSYSDRSTLSGISETDDDESWTSFPKRPVPPPVFTGYATSPLTEYATSPPLSPISPLSPVSPRSFRMPITPDSDRSPSPSSAVVQPSRWHKPRLLFP
jgi:serine/threonine protein kinase